MIRFSPESRCMSETIINSKKRSKLRALQTLARRTKRLRIPRSVWSASGLPALLHGARPSQQLLTSPKAGASSRTPNADATYHALPGSAKRLECVRLADAFARRATTSTTTRVCKSGSKLRALQTLARSSRILAQTTSLRSRCRFLASHFKNTFIPLVPFRPKSRVMK